MALARFFDRTFEAIGPHLSVSREALEHRLSDVMPAVACGSHCADLPSCRWTAELATNLLARLYPRLAIVGPEEIVSGLVDLALSINPAIEVTNSLDDVDFAVAVGDIELGTTRGVYTRSDGWVAQVAPTPDPSPHGPANPYSAAAAACLAVSECFRYLVLGRTGEELKPYSFSVLDYSSSGGIGLELPSTDLGEVAVVGLGAIGNAVTWALSKHTSLRGSLALVDPETIELSNLQRYALARNADVGRSKTEVAAATLAGTTLALKKYGTDLAGFADGLGESFTVPTVCISVDNAETRRFAQALLPRLLVNGWTADARFGVTWHTFDATHACLACLYHPQGKRPSRTDLVAEALGLEQRRAADLWLGGQAPTDDELEAIATRLGAPSTAISSWRGRSLPDLYTEVICGAANLDLVGAGHVEAVPLAHQSTLAGVLLAAELVKRVDPDLTRQSHESPIVQWNNVLAPPPMSWTQPRTTTEGCICGDSDYRAVFEKKWRTQ